MAQPDPLEGFTLLRNRSARPFVTVTKKLVTFSRMAISELGEPAYVHVLFNEATKSFAVQACERDADAIPFVRQGSSQHTSVARWGDAAVVGPIQRLLDPKSYEGGSVRILGESYPDRHLIIFDALDTIEKSR